jgi:hypothetical protein
MSNTHMGWEFIHREGGLIMKLRVARVAVLALACAGVSMTFGGPPWMKLDAAKAMAAASGKPIAVYATVNSKAEGC